MARRVGSCLSQSRSRGRETAETTPKTGVGTMTLNSSATAAPTIAANRIRRLAEAARRGIAGIPGIRWIRWRLDCRAGERAMWRLDDRMLRDIGLTRWDIHAAAY